MPSAAPAARAGSARARYSVALTRDEVARIDQWGQELGLTSRSMALRILIRAGLAHQLPGRQSAQKLPSR